MISIEDEVKISILPISIIIRILSTTKPAKHSPGIPHMPATNQSKLHLPPENPPSHAWAQPIGHFDHFVFSWNFKGACKTGIYSKVWSEAARRYQIGKGRGRTQEVQRACMEGVDRDCRMVRGMLSKSHRLVNFETPRNEDLPVSKGLSSLWHRFVMGTVDQNETKRDGAKIGMHERSWSQGVSIYPVLVMDWWRHSSPLSSSPSTWGMFSRSPVYSTRFP